MSSLAMMAKMLGGKPSESSPVKAVTMESQDTRSNKSTGATQPAQTDKNSNQDIQARIEADLKACKERLAASQFPENRSTPVPTSSNKDDAEKLKELVMGARPTAPTLKNP